jgi:hypothetical protein
LVLSNEYCKVNETSCWPTQSEIKALNDSLTPTALRNLSWSGGVTPQVSAIPFAADFTNTQPLYGLGLTGLKALYVRTDADLVSGCFETKSSKTFVTDFCLAAIRNNPIGDNLPAFVAWPLNP